jgi:hypothetical protein
MRIRSAAPKRANASAEKKRAWSRRPASKNPRFFRSDSSPYTLKPGLQRVNIELIEKIIRKSPQKYRTDKLTLLEIADRILQKEIGMPRPAKLKAYMMFGMFVKNSGRVRSGVNTVCHDWQGATKAGSPVLTTVNAIHGHRLVVDARKYIVENPIKGKRRNFRSRPHNLCGNVLCVNPRHIEMRGLPQEMKSGENHARAKYTDKLVRKVALEYNRGATAKQLAKKYGMSLTYVEQVMRKERRTLATDGLTIRGRFGKW